MTQRRPVAIAVDAVGGDFAPHAVLAGVSIALADDPSLTVHLVGPEDVVLATDEFADRIVPHVATERIAMDEHPAAAVRSKRDSSINVGCRLVKEGVADAFFSAGSTGAAMAAATLVIGRLPGVMRPAIATVLPTAGEPTVLLDVGANADCRPEHLVQFAQMGAAYSSVVLGVERPRVALLNIGEEPTKGSQLAVEAHALMSRDVDRFVGNVEGSEVIAGCVDVIVTDGFTGNVTLKLLEGTSRVLLSQVRHALTSNLVRSAAAAVVRPSLERLKDRLDPDAYGGAPLLGVGGVCIVGHGSSGERAVASALGVAARAVRGRLTELVAQRIVG